jgi:hypothetical protein
MSESGVVSIKILGYNYTIVEGGASEVIGAFGRFHPKSQTIQLAENLCDEQKLSTLLHEIIEAINYHFEMELDHRIIMSLEAGLYQVMVDNNVDLEPLLEGVRKND